MCKPGEDNAVRFIYYLDLEQIMHIQTNTACTGLGQHIQICASWSACIRMDRSLMLWIMARYLLESPDSESIPENALQCAQGGFAAGLAHASNRHARASGAHLGVKCQALKPLTPSQLASDVRPLALPVLTVHPRACRSWHGKPSDRVKDQWLLPAGPVGKISQGS